MTSTDSEWLERTSQQHQLLFQQFSLQVPLLWSRPPRLLLLEPLTLQLMRKHLPLPPRLPPTPPRRGRGGHLRMKMNLSPSLNLSLSPNLRRTGRRGKPSPSTATTRSPP